MKKRYFTFIFFVFCSISIFGNTDGQEEVDSLLFFPNSSNRFQDEKQAVIQLDNLARYLSAKDLFPGQIIVYGYAASAPNNIKSAELSKERAVFVIKELQKRGVSPELFSEPVGHGEVYLWGNNTNEKDRLPNRRVRIVLDGETPVVITHEIIATETETETVISDSIYEDPAAQENTSEESTYRFPWWFCQFLRFLLALLLLAIIAAIIFFLLKKRTRKTAKKDVKYTVAAAVTKSTANLDEEIRRRAYELYQQRNGRNGSHEQDWLNAVREVSARYTARGYSVYTKDGSWWASRSYNY
jgi:hypothetical protein